MERGESHQPVPVNATNANILGGMETLLFVLAGVAVARLPAVALVPAVVAIVAILLLIRWLNAAGDCVREASPYLRRRNELRSLLLDDLREIMARSTKTRWTYREFVEAIDWWF